MAGGSPKLQSQAPMMSVSNDVSFLRFPYILSPRHVILPKHLLLSLGVCISAYKYLFINIYVFMLYILNYEHIYLFTLFSWFVCLLDHVCFVYQGIPGA